MSPPRSIPRGRWRLVFALALALALLGFFFHNVPFREIAGAIRRAHFTLILDAIVVTFATYVVRTWRWQILLLPIDAAPFRPAFRATVIGFTASFLLPFKIGEILRPYMYARGRGIRFTSTLATIVLERVLDSSAVLLLFGCFAIFGNTATMNPRWLRVVNAFGLLGAAAALAALLLMFICAGHPERLGRFAGRVSRVLPARAAAAVARLVRTFLEGFAVMRRPGPLFAAALLSIPMWLLIATGIWLVTRAFDLTMPFTGTFLVMMFLVLGVAVPTPGGVGSFELAYQKGLTMFFGAAAPPAVAAALMLHAVSFVPISILGLFFMGQEGLTLAGLQRMRAAAEADGSAGGGPDGTGGSAS